MESERFEQGRNRPTQYESFFDSAISAFWSPIELGLFECGDESSDRLGFSSVAKRSMEVKQIAGFAASFQGAAEGRCRSNYRGRVTLYQSRNAFLANVPNLIQRVWDLRIE